MRKFALLITLTLLAFTTQSQISEMERMMAVHYLQKAEAPRDDIDNSIITANYIIQGANLRMIHMQQSFQGIPVYNQFNVVTLKNDETLVSYTGTRIPALAQRLNGVSIIPAVSPEAALSTALTAINVITGRTFIPQKVSPDGRKFEYDKLDIATENISSELMWYPLPGSGEVKLVWQVFLAPRNSSDYWLVWVDAKNGGYIDKMSLTVYDNWDEPKCQPINEQAFKSTRFRIDENLQTYKPTNLQTNSPYVVNSAAYRVVPYPAESPIHPGGAHALVTNPWSVAPGDATALGWHFDGSLYYQNTRGNNVYAYEDRANSNSPGLSPSSSTPQPDLNFNFTPNYTLSPTVTSPSPNQQFNTTNLFYWNNLIHDLSYLYGFDEASRNFQNNNNGHPGSGGDYVQAEAQDGGGTNNANFATYADGTRPRMQMYLWTGSPSLDGDVDNGIIIHEYTHGISNRLTGNGYSCLGNAEQMGEGWSDYFALMMTQDWATSLTGDGFSKPRGIGTYALGQPITGVGIRQYRYTTDMSINPMTYSNLPNVVAPHGVGTIWCTVLWDMTWAIIQQAGINPSLHNINGGGGNAIALKLVLEGLRLQPCSPGFIDGRNAILQADQLFFGGQYHCIIMNAFARRGMGEGASQGSSNSRTDQTVSFTPCSAPVGCAAPTGLTSSSVTLSSASISWTAASGAVSYDVDYKANSSGTWISVAAGTASTSVDLSGLSQSTLYDWRVITNCSTATSTYSQAQFTTTTPPTACPGIYDVSTNGTTSGAAVIPLNTDIKGLINPSNDKDHYKFTVGAAGSVSLSLTNLPANYDLRLLSSGGSKLAESHKSGTVNELIVKNVSAGTYYALVFPKTSAFNATICYTLKVTASNSFAPEEGDDDEDGFSGSLNVKGITVYPNPVNAELVISVPDIKGIASISLYDMYGRELVRKSSGNALTMIDVKGLAAGLYVVRVRNEGREWSVKVVKQ